MLKGKGLIDIHKERIIKKLSYINLLEFSYIPILSFHMDVQTIIISICFMIFFLVAYYIWKTMYDLQFRVDSLESRLNTISSKNMSTDTVLPSSSFGSTSKKTTTSDFKVAAVDNVFTPVDRNSSLHTSEFAQEGGKKRHFTEFQSAMNSSDLNCSFMDAPLSIVQRILGEEHILNPSELLENVGISLSTIVNEGIKDLMMDNEKVNFTSFIFSSSGGMTHDKETDQRVFEVLNDLDDVSESNVGLLEDRVSSITERVLMGVVQEEECPRTLSDDIVNEYKSKTVLELKVICQTNGLSTAKSSGHKTKKELVETILQYLQQKNEDVAD